MNVRMVSAGDLEEVKRQMRAIGVDKYGIQIMAPKSCMHLVKIEGLSNIAANVLKQEMLSLGGDVAVSRGSLTGATKKTDCLVIGNDIQVNRLNEKLRMQPFKLGELACQIKDVLHNYGRDKFVVKTRRFTLDLKKRPMIMGIVNLTDDSFSGDGLLNKIKNQKSKIKIVNEAIRFTEKMVEDGADIIDIGGESTRPGARPVPLKEELARIIPVIKLLVKRIKVPISVDTYKPEVAKQALDAGASIVNDIMGTDLDNRIAKLVASFDAALIIMHIKGRPRTMQNNPKYKSLMAEIIFGLKGSIDKALKLGVNSSNIIIDPGIGFGKTSGHNLFILKHLSELKSLGYPILVGPSRKSFIGKVLGGVPAHNRLMGTAAACALAVANGANILRVHDVKEVKQVIKLTQAIRGAKNAAD
ncbi:MAG: dihydropteroate synthase [Candidatus Omnitrophota bacterium]